MIELEQKYQALLEEGQRLGLGHGEEIALCFHLLSLAGGIDRDCAALLAPHGLTEGRFVLLFLLNASEAPLSPHILAARAGVTRATITGLLDGLERAALICRQPALGDRRSLHIALTPEGRALAQQLFIQHGRWIGSLFTGLSAEERATLRRLLVKVAQGLPACRQDAEAAAHV